MTEDDQRPRALLGHVHTDAVCLDGAMPPTVTPVGLSPTERASLRWSHNVCFRGFCLTGRSVAGEDCIFQNTTPRLFAGISVWVQYQSCGFCILSL